MEEEDGRRGEVHLIVLEYMATTEILCEDFWNNNVRDKSDNESRLQKRGQTSELNNKRDAEEQIWTKIKTG